MAVDNTPIEVIIKKLEIAWELTTVPIQKGAVASDENTVKRIFREMYDAITEAVDKNDYNKTASEESEK